MCSVTSAGIVEKSLAEYQHKKIVKHAKILVIMIQCSFETMSGNRLIATGMFAFPLNTI